MIAKSVGTQLRDGRESKKFSLDDLESLTGIKSSYLLSMEMDQFSLLPSKSYEISYIKKYAQAVDLDHEAILRDYHIAVAEKQERLASRQTQSSDNQKDSESYSRSQAVQQTTSHREKPKSGKKSKANIVLLVLSLLTLIALLAFVYVTFWNQNNAETGNAFSKTTVSSSSSKETTTSSSSESPQLTVTPSTDGINLNVQLSRANKPVDIIFNLTEGSLDNWFSVSNSNYEAGESLSSETPTIRVALAEDISETVITLANTSGVDVTVNGQELDLSSLLADTTAYITLTIE